MNKWNDTKIMSPLEEFGPEARQTIVPIDMQAPVEYKGPKFVGTKDGVVKILENGKLRPVTQFGLAAEELGYDEEKTMKDEDIFASPSEMAKGAIGAIKALAKDGVKICSANERKDRLEVCKGCEYHAPKFNRCRKCGCFLEVKVSIVAWHCPIDKW